MFVELTLNDCFSFKTAGRVVQRLQDNTEAPVIITGWQIPFFIIIDPDDRSQDIMGASQITSDLEGEYEISLTDVQRDLIYTIYPNKKGLTFHVKAIFFDGTGKTLATGDIKLTRS